MFVYSKVLFEARNKMKSDQMGHVYIKSSRAALNCLCTFYTLPKCPNWMNCLDKVYTNIYIKMQINHYFKETTV